jgi:hypothetical protein
MTDTEVACMVALEIDGLDEKFITPREIPITHDFTDGSGRVIYSVTDDGVIIPYFRTMRQYNTL